MFGQCACEEGVGRVGLGLGSHILLSSVCGCSTTRMSGLCVWDGL